MSRDDFLASVSVACSALSPTVQADGRPNNADYLTTVMRRADLWLTTKSVEGFNARDWTHWARDAQERLRVAVERFKAIAEQVPAKGPATLEQSESARRLLREIAMLLRSHGELAEHGETVE